MNYELEVIEGPGGEGFGSVTWSHRFKRVVEIVDYDGDKYHTTLTEIPGGWNVHTWDGKYEGSFPREVVDGWDTRTPKVKWHIIHPRPPPRVWAPFISKSFVSSIIFPGVMLFVSGIVNELTGSSPFNYFFSFICAFNFTRYLWVEYGFVLED